jgi:hypothetical protein
MDGDGRTVLPFAPARFLSLDAFVPTAEEERFLKFELFTIAVTHRNDARVLQVAGFHNEIYEALG